jgi:hypothetical protein
MSTNNIVTDFGQICNSLEKQCFKFFLNFINYYAVFQLVWTIDFSLVRCPCSVVFTMTCTSQLLAVLSEILPFGNKFLDVMCGTEATVKFPVQLIGTRHSLHINVQDMGSVSLMFGDVIREATFIKVPCNLSAQ